MKNDAIAIDLTGFHTISLEETNAKASMMERVDRKYLVDAEGLQGILDQQALAYRLMAISGKTVFKYRSHYFDDHYQCYFDHLKGRRKRHKIRIRHYVDTGLLFLELKLKGGRGQTLKFRENCHSYDTPFFDKNSRAYRFVDNYYQTHYGTPFTTRLRSSLTIEYTRFTLVSNAGEERVTIDSDITFQDTIEGKQWSTGREIFIVETKTVHGRGVMDTQLRRHGFQSQNGCSKYCIGVAITERVSRYNIFMPVLRRLKSLSNNNCNEPTRYSGNYL